MLLSYPDLHIDKYSEKDIDNDLLEWFNNSIINFYNTIKYKVINFDNNGDIISNTAYNEQTWNQGWKGYTANIKSFPVLYQVAYHISLVCICNLAPLLVFQCQLL